MKKDKWVWMPHAGHFICGNYCRFHLNTYVGGYIVSTVDEYLPSESSREIHAQVRGIVLQGNGDARERDFLDKCGFVELGINRTFETMVFKAKRSDDKCCPYTVTEFRELDFLGYKKSGDAFNGHMELCEKWSRK